MQMAHVLLLLMVKASVAEDHASFVCMQQRRRSCGTLHCNCFVLPSGSTTLTLILNFFQPPPLFPLPPPPPAFAFITGTSLHRRGAAAAAIFTLVCSCCNACMHWQAKVTPFNSSTDITLRQVACFRQMCIVVTLAWCLLHNRKQSPWCNGCHAEALPLLCSFRWTGAKAGRFRTC